jgi:hypothetical protein
MEYKPLIDLREDHEAVRQIFEWYADVKQPDNIWYDSEFNTINAVHQGTCKQSLSIWADDGEIFFEVDDKDCAVTHPFQIVDLIRSLGYSA